MSKLSRRHFVASGLAGVGTATLPFLANEARAATVTRSNLASLNGQAMLKKYAAAVKLMKARPPGDPLSWTFQWYHHAVPSNTTKQAQLNAIYGPGPSPNKSLATLVWNTCHGHFGPEQFFLPWHRMYVCAFENIIRRVLSDPTFALPYWNYSVAAGFALPQPFRMQNDPVFGPLFEPKRRPPVNAGQPIFTGIGSASDLSAAGVLAESNYSPNGAIPGFNRALDQGLHGNVHVFVGTNQNMGAIPFAAGDPIFWMHHCNIDRLWATWNQNHTNPTTPAYLSKTFVFAGPNGQRINSLVRDHMTTAKCEYRYDQLAAPALVVAASPAAAAAAAVAPAAAAAPVTLAAPAASNPIQLGTAPARVTLRPSAPSAGAAPASAAMSPLAARLQELRENRGIYLVLNKLSAAETPEAIYRVYLDLPEGTPDDPLNSHYVGSFNFFDAAAPAADHADHASKPVSFDISAVVANLQARGALKPEHSVTIVPSGRPTEEAKAVVGEISIVEQ